MDNIPPFQKTFFDELYDVNCHEVPEPRIIGGSKIPKTLRTELGNPPTDKE